MLSCWAEQPEKRPPFFTLRQDLDDFDTAVEHKYQRYDDLLPKRKEAGGRNKGTKQDKREAAKAGRVRRKPKN